MQSSHFVTSKVHSPNLLVGAAFLLIVAGGIAEGLSTNRWLPNLAVARSVELLENVPAEFGNWTSEDLVLSDVDLQVGGIEGYVQRMYTDSRTGTKVFMLLVTGEAGPISVHPPTACFSGRGFHVVGQQKVMAIDERVDESSSRDHIFHAADFANTAVDDASLTRVYWAWSPDSQWQAPDNARMKFAGQSALFKMYVSERWVPTGDVRQSTGAAKSFLKEMIPVLSESLAADLPE